MTINGGSYTFNGYGEFVMLRYDNAIDFQARMRPVADGTKATQFSAFAFGYIDGDKVTVRHKDIFLLSKSLQPFSQLLQNCEVVFLERLTFPLLRLTVNRQTKCV